jgi:hypothetical protein
MNLPTAPRTARHAVGSSSRQHAATRCNGQRSARSKCRCAVARGFNLTEGLTAFGKFASSDLQHDALRPQPARIGSALRVSASTPHRCTLSARCMRTRQGSVMQMGARPGVLGKLPRRQQALCSAPKHARAHAWRPDTAKSQIACTQIIFLPIAGTGACVSRS